jgi:tyrosyl-tRNA synthetase
MRIAKTITAIYQGEEQADQAEAHFVRVFQKQQVPDDIPEFKLSVGRVLLEVLVESKLVSTRSEAKRMLRQKAVRLDKQVLEDPWTLPGPGVLRVGKRRFVRLVSADD